MNLFIVELRKILGRRIVWIGLTVIVSFMALWVWESIVAAEDTVVDGVRYRGLEAIRKDREIARAWEGPLTAEKLFRILDTYGIAGDETDGELVRREGNWVSRYATDLLTDYRNRKASGVIRMLSGEALETEEERIARNPSYFCYTQNMDFLYEAAYSMNLFLLVLTAVTLAPAFAQEHQALTAPVLLTCAKGVGETAFAKCAAALAFAEGIYLLANGTLLGAYLMIYGTDGLRATNLCGIGAGIGFASLTNGQLWGINLAWGAFGMCLMCALTLFFSAKLRQSFLSLSAALACLAGGIASFYVFPALFGFAGLRILFRLAGLCSPFPMMLAASTGAAAMPVTAGIVLWLLISCAVGIRRYWRPA